MTSTRRGPVRGRSSRWLALVALFALVVPAPVLGQDADDGGPAFPTTLAGLEIDATTYTADEWLDQFRGGESDDPAFVESTEAFLESVGGSLDHLTVKSGMVEPAPGDRAAVLAMRLDGLDARDFVTEAVDLLLGDLVDPGFVMRPMAGKWALRVTDAENPGVYPRTVYLLDDTAWFIEGDEPYVWEALEQLPDEVHGAVPGAESLVTKVPLELGGKRRTLLYEATEPLWLPTLSVRLGAEIEEWLVDLYLEYGFSPAEMLGIDVWWGIDSSQESVQVEGYQLPGGPPEMVERLLSEIILAEDTELPEGMTMSDAELGGREVTTIDDGLARQHVFSSGDTVWIVTDHVDEPALAEEAVAALP